MGRQTEAEALYRVDVAAERAQGGDRHRNTLAALADRPGDQPLRQLHA